jgi:acyl-CoA-dependent ceramide synthase
VTLWLIGWSYGLHLTYIGVAIFLTMDISDIFLAVRLLTNSHEMAGLILSWPNASTTSASTGRSSSLPSSWASGREWSTCEYISLTISYFRHYLNLKILWSVYHEFNLIPYVPRLLEADQD